MQPSLFGRPGVAAAVRILQISKQLRQNPGLGYATAFISVGVASGLQWLAQDQYAGSPFLTIYPAVIVTALVGGTGAGFLAAALAGGSQWGFFIPTFHWFAFLSYAFDATVCVMLIDFINRTLDILLINIDREKQAKQHQYLLAKELHHRIQNLFTVIPAVIRFSLPGEGMVRESAVKQRLMDRLQSMSATNRAITDSMGDGVRLNDLISSEIRGFESQFEISGNPHLVLGPQMTQNLSLILHELLTNALKYGALSVPHGRVNVRLDWTSCRLAGTRRPFGIAAGGLRLRQPDPWSLRQELLPRRQPLLRPRRAALHAADSFGPEQLRRTYLGWGHGNGRCRLGT
jgi:signal transduction histidine kinase